MTIQYQIQQYCLTSDQANRLVSSPPVSCYHLYPSAASLIAYCRRVSRPGHCSKSMQPVTRLSTGLTFTINIQLRTMEFDPGILCTAVRHLTTDYCDLMALMICCYIWSTHDVSMDSTFEAKSSLFEAKARSFRDHGHKILRSRPTNFVLEVSSRTRTVSQRISCFQSNQTQTKRTTIISNRRSHKVIQ